MRIIKIKKGIVMEVKQVSEGYILRDGELKSDIGEIGQVQQSDGSFTDSPPTQAAPETTLEDKINFIYYKQMGVL